MNLTVGRDIDLLGEGLMHGKLIGLVTAAHAWTRDGPERAGHLPERRGAGSALDAPAAVDDRSFDVTLVDAGQWATARVAPDHDAPADIAPV